MNPHNLLRRTLPYTLLLLLLIGTFAMAESTPPPNLIEKVLNDRPDRFKTFTDDPAAYRLQVLLSVPDDSAPNDATLARHGYRLEAEYFYPASAIKTYASAAALIHLEDLRRSTGTPVDHHTPMVIHPLFDDEKLQTDDPANVETGKMTIGMEIRKTQLVSSNSAYNHLYEFVGHEKLHLLLGAAGLTETRLNHRLSEFRSVEDNLRTPKFEFHAGDYPPLVLDEQTSNYLTDNAGLQGLKIGNAYYSGGKRIDEPLDFLHKNHSSLQDMQDFLIKITHPQIDLGTPALPLRDGDRAFLKQALNEHPHDSINPVYTKSDVSRAEGDPFYQAGLERVAPRGEWLVHAKAGRAYGFSLENAAVTHLPTGKTFFLAAVIYTNPNQTLNDDDYDYDTADQFMADLGEAVAWELCD